MTRSQAIGPRAGERALRTILLLAFVVRGALFLIALPDERRFVTPDGEGYAALARDLRAGYLDAQSPLFVAGLSRTPVYPIFISTALSFPRGVPAVVAMDILLSVATVWFVYLIGRRLLTVLEASAAAGLLAIAPASAIYSAQLQPEALFTALVSLAVLQWVRAQEARSFIAASVAGLLIGIAILTRPIALYFPIVLLAWSWPAPYRRRLWTGLMIPIVALAGGWVARNAMATGVPLLSTIQGVNLLEYRAAGALAYESGGEFESTRDDLRARLAQVLPASSNAAEISRAQTRLAIEVLCQHPRGWIATSADGVIRTLVGTGETALARLVVDPSLTRLRLLLALLVATLLLSAVYGAILLWRGGRRPAATLFLGVAGYFVLIAAGPEANTRFRVPAEPFIALLGGVGIASVLQRVSGTRAADPRPPGEAS